jgi:hypothetical protein
MECDIILRKVYKMIVNESQLSIASGAMDTFMRIYIHCIVSPITYYRIMSSNERILMYRRSLLFGVLDRVDSNTTFPEDICD